MGCPFGGTRNINPTSYTSPVAGPQLQKAHDEYYHELLAREQSRQDSSGFGDFRV